MEGYVDFRGPSHLDLEVVAEHVDLPDELIEQGPAPIVCGRTQIASQSRSASIAATSSNSALPDHGCSLWRVERTLSGPTTPVRLAKPSHLRRLAFQMLYGRRVIQVERDGQTTFSYHEGER